MTKAPAQNPRKDHRGMSSTMSLVIGIILGSFIAMILIVIIVLKVRTGVELDNIKQLQVFFCGNLFIKYCTVMIFSHFHNHMIVNIRHIEYRPRDDSLQKIESKKLRSLNKDINAFFKILPKLSIKIISNDLDILQTKILSFI